jgi:dUTP pyrophosphatase
MNILDPIIGDTTNLMVYKCNNHAIMPSYATISSAAIDLHACIDKNNVFTAYDEANEKFRKRVGEDRTVRIDPKERVMIPTGLIFDIPKDHYITVHPRSGTALKHGLNLINQTGIVDEDYVNETFILIHNSSDVTVQIRHGERIAQAILHRRNHINIIDKGFADSIPQKTDRTGGFNSTGK